MLLALLLSVPPSFHFQYMPGFLVEERIGEEKAPEDMLLSCCC